MGKIVLKKLHLNKNVEINFNNGENYIIGGNNSGKSTLFQLIQYILGLKSNSSRINYLKDTFSPYLDCQFRNKKVRIKRNFNSRTVVFEGDISAEIQANSKELNDIYTELLGIRFFSNFNQGSTLDILRFSFFSELDFKNYNFLKLETYKQIIGYNPEYLDSIKKDINNLEKLVETEVQSLNTVEQYRQAVEISLRNSSNNKIYDDFQYILDEEFSKIRKNFNEKYELLQDAKNIYSEEILQSEKFLDAQLSKLEPFFYNAISNLYFENKNLLKNNFKEIIKMRPSELNSLSFGEKTILLFILHLTFCRNLRNLEYNNGLGLLVTDNSIIDIDYYTKRTISEKINEITNSEELQYINFCINDKYIPRESIVFDLSPKQGGDFIGR